MELNRELDDWYDAWLEYRKNTEAPQLYNKWVAVSMIASVLERKVYLRWDKRIYPNLYIVLVGPPGCRKGTAMSPGRELLDEMNVKIAADATSKEKLSSRLKEASDNFEALDGQIHSYAALTIFSEEFSVFLGYGNIELMQWMSDWYDCKNKWKYETKHQGIDEIEGVWVNLIGATTPELLQESMPRESFGGGLNSRIIYVYADQKEKIVIFPFLTLQDEALKDQLARDLQIMRLISGEYEPTQSYLDEWERWYPEQYANHMSQDDRMGGYIDRRPTHLHKLAMIFNASRGGGLKLTDHDFNRARNLLEETERHMSKTFAGVGKSEFSSVMNRALQYIRMHGKVAYSEVLKRFYYDADDRSLATIIATLERAKLIRLSREEPEGLDGRRDYWCIYQADEVERGV